MHHKNSPTPTRNAPNKHIKVRKTKQEHVKHKTQAFYNKMPVFCGGGLQKVENPWYRGWVWLCPHQCQKQTNSLVTSWSSWLKQLRKLMKISLRWAESISRHDHRVTVSASITAQDNVSGWWLPIWDSWDKSSHISLTTVQILALFRLTFQKKRLSVFLHGTMLQIHDNEVN